MKSNFDVVIADSGTPIKMWTKGVPVEDSALQQLKNVASLPFIYSHLAVMPDVHYGIGATVGSVIASKGAIVPGSVGVDIGCGMCAVMVDVKAHELPDNLKGIRSQIERTVPHGNGPGGNFSNSDCSKAGKNAFESFNSELWYNYEQRILGKNPKLRPSKSPATQVGTLGGGNHFIEICLDKEDNVWIMLHSGSRGIGNRIGRHFIELAKEDMRRHFINLPDKNLAYLVEGSEHFDDYCEAVGWAQAYARVNRDVMLENIQLALERDHSLPYGWTKALTKAVNCHHNYISHENHFGQNVWVTRKGAVRARQGDLGIIPGSMGARSYIVRGLGNKDAFHSCSH